MALRAEFTYCEACAGYGGLGLAFKIIFGERARCVCYIERDACAAAALVARMEAKELDQAPVWDDIESFDGKPWRGRVDCFTAGFPCQPWSQAGERKGIADKRWLWPALARAIGDMGPRVVFLENVPGLISGNGLEPVLVDLAEMGYDAEWGCLAASDVGASQERERVYVLAKRQNERCEWLRGAWRWRIGLEDSSPRCGKPLGNCTKPRSGRVAEGPRTEGEGTIYANRSGSELADSECSRLEGNSGEFIDRERREAFGLVSERERVAGARGTRHKESERPASSSGSTAKLREVPLFPPGPGEFEQWREVLDIRPDLAPALSKSELRRMADGSASRVDSLRLSGNGVVPLAAAAAFLALSELLLEGYRK